MLADVIARTAMSPAELPIGVVTAFFGAPFFAVILRTSSRMASRDRGSRSSGVSVELGGRRVVDGVSLASSRASG